MEDANAKTTPLERSKPSARRSRWPLTTVFFVLGLFAGAALAGLIRLQPIPEPLLDVRESRYGDVDKTCEAIRTAIETKGFHCKGILNLNNAMAKHGVHLDRQVRVVQFGRASFAHDILKDKPETSALMPCGFGVYEGDDGKCHISGLNRVVVGRILGGAVADVMGKKVAQDLSAALHDQIR